MAQLRRCGLLLALAVAGISAHAATVVVELDSLGQVRLYQLAQLSSLVEVVTLVPLPPGRASQIVEGRFDDVEVSYGEEVSVVRRGEVLWQLDRTDHPAAWRSTASGLVGTGEISFISLGIPGGVPLGTLEELRAYPLRATTAPDEWHAWLLFTPGTQTINLALSRGGLILDRIIQFELPPDNLSEYQELLPRRLVDFGVVSLADDGEFVIIGTGAHATFSTYQMVARSDNPAHLQFASRIHLPVASVRRLDGPLGKVRDFDFESLGKITTPARSGEKKACEVDGSHTKTNSCSISESTCSGQFGGLSTWTASCSVTCYGGYKPCCNCLEGYHRATCTCEVDQELLKGCLIPIQLGPPERGQ